MGVYRINRIKRSAGNSETKRVYDFRSQRCTAAVHPENKYNFISGFFTHINMLFVAILGIKRLAQFFNIRNFRLSKNLFIFIFFFMSAYFFKIHQRWIFVNELKNFSDFRIWLGNKILVFYFQKPLFSSRNFFVLIDHDH